MFPISSIEEEEDCFVDCDSSIDIFVSLYIRFYSVLIPDKEKKEIRKKISPSLASTSVIIQ